MQILLPSSKLQASIASALESYRRLFLQQALSSTIRELSLSDLNAELDRIVPAKDLTHLASLGIRGEFLFAIPAVLRANPRLLGYYRLVLGFSQKEFYQKSNLGRFDALESRGVIPARVSPEVEPLCASLSQRASELMAEIGPEKLSLDLLNELALLTLGAQFRGGLNTKIGQIADRAVFELIEGIAKHAVTHVTKSKLELRNASGRRVVIAFSSDPDISITEEISSKTVKKVVAIEIKGGADKSNVWNRLGEAEKSHQSAKQRGFVEFWTIYNVLNLDLERAHEKSPTTNRFYSLADLLNPKTDASEDFRDRLIALLGIANAP